MVTLNRTEQTAQETQARNTLLRAWLSVATIPVFFILAFVVGEGLYSMFGYLPENADAPLWVELVCSIPALLIFLAPCAAAVGFGARSTRGGDSRGWIPLGIGAAMALWLTVSTVIGVVSTVLG